MGKSNAPQKGGAPTVQKHLHSRVSYLYRAASYFSGLSTRNQAGEQRCKTEAFTACNGGQVRQENPFSSGPGHIETPGQTTAADLPKVTTSPPEGSSMVYSEANTRMMLSYIKGISRKGQIRLSPSMKHSMCKRCDILLVHGRTSTQRLENRSREGKKPWADVLVVTCNSCGTAKRFPIGAKRQPNRKDRPGKQETQNLSENHQG